MSINNPQNYCIKNVVQLKIFGKNGNAYLLHSFKDFELEINGDASYCQFDTPYIPKGLIEDLSQQTYVDIIITHEGRNHQGTMLRSISARSKWSYTEIDNDNPVMPHFVFDELDIRDIDYADLGTEVKNESTHS